MMFEVFSDVVFTETAFNFKCLWMKQILTQAAMLSR